MLQTAEAAEAPDWAPLARIMREVSGEAELVEIQRLRGGVDALTYAVCVQEPGGESEWLVVRRWKPQTLTWNPNAPARVWITLNLLARHDVPAPRPVYLDATGELVGDPALVMTRVPGHATLEPEDRHAYLRDLGFALAAVHKLTVDETVGLPRDVVPELAELLAPGGKLAGPEGAALYRRIAQHIHSWRPQRERLGLVHGDYWAGNTLWQDGRLTSIVDWDQAALGDPHSDVGYCRVDLALMFGLEAADEFLAAYTEASDAPIESLRYWDLMAAVRAMPDGAQWMPGYLDLGRTDLTVPTLHARLTQFIDRALG